MGSHRAQGPALRRSRDVPTPAAGPRSHRAPTGRAARRAAVEEAPTGYLAVVLAQPADLSAPIEPVVALGERRARREAERLAAGHRAASPRRAAQRERAAAAPARGSSFVKVGGNLPRVGIAAALGLATIVTPVVGSMGSTADASSSTTTVAAPRTVSRAATTIALAPAMAESFRVVPQSSSEAAVAPAALAAAADGAQPGAARRDARPGRPGQPQPGARRAARLHRQAGRHRRRQRADRPRRPVRAVVGGVPAVRRRGRPGAAQRRVRHEFGRDLCITDGYRSYSEQVSVRWRKPGLAARPGTSQHGWGLAVDLCKGEASARAKEHTWLKENAPDFGWDNPDWARSGGSGPYEPWHWEYVAGQDDRS